MSTGRATKNRVLVRPDFSRRSLVYATLLGIAALCCCGLAPILRPAGWGNGLRGSRWRVQLCYEASPVYGTLIGFRRSAAGDWLLRRNGRLYKAARRSCWLFSAPGRCRTLTPRYFPGFKDYQAANIPFCRGKGIQSLKPHITPRIVLRLPLQR